MLKNLHLELAEMINHTYGSYSHPSGMVIVCDRTDDAARRIERVLWNDPASDVMRHANAGYESAVDCAREFGLNLPSLGAGE